MKINHIIIAAALFSLCACGSSKETGSVDQNKAETAPETSAPANQSGTTSSTTTSTPNTMTENSQVQEKQEATKYRLIVSFISIGEGTDMEAREIMNKIIRSWESKSAKTIIMEEFPWGREGEVDFCFLLNELSAPDQASFAREIRSAFQGRPLIQITEYQASMHKR